MPSSTCRSAPRTTTCCSPALPANASASPSTTCACSRAAPRWACAASISLSAAEQFVLTISEKGFGKRTSSYEYRTTGRGGKGIVAMAITERNGRLVASFPVEESDQIMLVTDGGQLIRCPVDGIRIAGRSTQGVIVFSTAEGERVALVERLTEDTQENGGE